jgi:hypothetical protein
MVEAARLAAKLMGGRGIRPRPPEALSYKKLNYTFARPRDGGEQFLGVQQSGVVHIHDGTGRFLLRRKSGLNNLLW